MAKSGSSSKKVANGMVAAGAAAVMAVYAAGYAKTNDAATKMEAQSDDRRPGTGRSGGVPAGRGPAAESVEGRGPATGDTRPETAPGLAGAQAPVTQPGHDNQPIQVASLDHGPAPMTMPSASVPEVKSTPEPTAAKPEHTAEVTPAPVATPAPAPVTPAPVAVAPVPAPAPAPVVATITPAPAPAPPPQPAAPPAPKWKDGKYTGWGTSRHGDIQAFVVIEGGRIASAGIEQCLTRYSCSVIGRIIPQVAQRQSPETDYVSGATQSTNAFYYGVIEALNKAKSEAK